MNYERLTVEAQRELVISALLIVERQHFQALIDAEANRLSGNAEAFERLAATLEKSVVNLRQHFADLLSHPVPRQLKLGSP